jgi:hypothetical protein
VKIFFWVLFGHLEEVIVLTKKERAPTAAAGFSEDHIFVSQWC